MKIIFWSGTGNTEEMANLILKGIREAGKDAELINVSNDSISSISEDKVIVLGCPSMGDEELEDSEFLPALEGIEDDLKGKNVALFGSYGWGAGEWMDSFKERMIEKGAIVSLEPVIVNAYPEGDDAENCIELGRQIANL